MYYIEHVVDSVLADAILASREKKMFVICLDSDCSMFELYMDDGEVHIDDIGNKVADMLDTSSSSGREIAELRLTSSGLRMCSGFVDSRLLRFADHGGGVMEIEIAKFACRCMEEQAN